jgi:DNA-binding transcriptional MerR regulator
VAKLQIMEDALNIQQMALVTGLSAHTLRYYERAGLMRRRIGRNDTNQYRYYTQQDVSWLTFIKRLRATGMPIREIQRYTELVRQGDQTAPERMNLLRQHQKRVQEQLKEVQEHLTAITNKIAYYEQGNACEPENTQNQPFDSTDRDTSRSQSALPTGARW